MSNVSHHSIMNRTTFLVAYILGTIAVMVTGYPWSQLNVLLLQPSKAGVALDGAFWIALLVPLLLIVVAVVRGNTIARPRLFVLPLLAFCLSGTAFGYGWLSRALASGELSASGFLPMPVAMSLGLVSAFAPLVLHIVCCVAGAAAPKSQPTAHG